MLPGPVIVIAPPPHSMVLSGHDAFEEYMRRQGKNLRKRAVTRNSAKLSRKRKGAICSRYLRACETDGFRWASIFAGHTVGWSELASVGEVQTVLLRQLIGDQFRGRSDHV